MSAIQIAYEGGNGQQIASVLILRIVLVLVVVIVIDLLPQVRSRIDYDYDDEDDLEAGIACDLLAITTCIEYLNGQT